MKKKIVCITASFPYGNREVYFQNELSYLCAHFDEVYVIPLYNPYEDVITREMDRNVRVLPVLLKSGLLRLLDGLLQFRWNNSYAREFFKFKVYKSRFKFKKWLNSQFIKNAFEAKINKILKECDLSERDTILYSYWAEAPFFLNTSISAFHKIVRMHGADFYTYRNRGYLPVRDLIYNSCNKLVPISQDIADNLRTEYSVPSDKIVVSYLGTSNYQSKCALKEIGDSIRFCSCSHVYPLKRVHLILNVIRQLSERFTVFWDHYGDGESLDFVKSYVASSPSDNIKIQFKGHVDPTSLKKHYEKNYYDWFINVSEHEGLPVSIMEAFSFGIPTVATNVGGVGEIVTEKNGILIPKDFDAETVGKQIEMEMGYSYVNKRINAFETWQKRFNSDHNYKQLINDIQV